MKDLLIGTLTRLGGPGICYVRTDGEHLTQLWTDGTLTDPNWQDVSPDGRIFSVSCDGPEPMDGCIHELTLHPLDRRKGTMPSDLFRGWTFPALR